MTKIINLFDRLLDDANDALGDLHDYSDQQIARVLKSFLSADRINVFCRMTHFIAGVQSAGLPMDEIIFGPQRSASWFRGQFEQAQPITTSSASLHENYVNRYADGSTFKIDYSAMPHLVCALNVAILFLEIDGFLARSQLITHALGKPELDKIASDWSDEFRAFSRQQGGSEQQRSVFEAIERFLTAAFDERSFSYTDIKSDHVLSFWETTAQTNDLDFVLYATAHRSFVDFVVAFAASVSERSTIHLSTDDNQDGLENRELAAAYAGGVTNYDDWLAVLEDSFGLKLLFQKTLSVVQPISDLAPEARQLLLSAGRAVTYGPLENKIIEGKRRQQPTGQLRSILSAGPEFDYVACLGYYQALCDAFRDVLLASAHILIVNERAEGIRLVQQVDTHLADQAALEDVVARYRQEDEGVSEYTFELFAQRFYRAIEMEGAPPPPFDAAFDRAHQAWRGVNRTGFKKNELFEPAIVDAHELIAARLPGAYAHLTAHLAKLRELFSDEENARQRHSNDLCRIRPILTSIHFQ